MRGLFSDQQIGLQIEELLKALTGTQTGTEYPNRFALDSDTFRINGSQFNSTVFTETATATFESDDGYKLQVGPQGAQLSLNGTKIGTVINNGTNYLLIDNSNKVSTANIVPQVSLSEINSNLKENDLVLLETGVETNLYDVHQILSDGWKNLRTETTQQFIEKAGIKSASGRRKTQFKEWFELFGRLQYDLNIKGLHGRLILNL